MSPADDAVTPSEPDAALELAATEPEPERELEPLPLPDLVPPPEMVERARQLDGELATVPVFSEITDERTTSPLATDQ